MSFGGSSKALEICSYKVRRKRENKSIPIVGRLITCFNFIVFLDGRLDQGPQRSGCQTQMVASEQAIKSTLVRIKANVKSYVFPCPNPRV